MNLPNNVDKNKSNLNGMKTNQQLMEEMNLASKAKKLGAHNANAMMGKPSIDSQPAS